MSGDPQLAAGADRVQEGTDGGAQVVELRIGDRRKGAVQREAAAGRVAAGKHRGGFPVPADQRVLAPHVHAPVRRCHTEHRAVEAIG